MGGEGRNCLSVFKVEISRNLKRALNAGNHGRGNIIGLLIALGSSFFLSSAFLSSVSPWITNDESTVAMCV